jgi:hypothetical protein
MREPAASLRQRTARAVGASRTARWLREDWRGLLIAAGVGGLLAASGAFGSGGAPLPQRLAYWILMLLAGAVIGAVVRRVVVGFGWLEDRPWLQAGLITLIITGPITLVVWVFSSWFFERPLDVADLGFFVGPVLIVSTLMAGLSVLAVRAPLETHAAAPGAAPPRFLERLPPKLRGGEVYAVEAEDHYLRLHTSRGSDLILLRLSDAVAELEGIEGAQTHRSWWVAKGAVEEARRSDGRAVLKLKGGVEAPVSRTYAKALREAGWF